MRYPLLSKLLSLEQQAEQTGSVDRIDRLISNKAKQYSAQNTPRSVKGGLLTFFSAIAIENGENIIRFGLEFFTNES